MPIKSNKTVATSFSDYKKDAHNWITLATGEYPNLSRPVDFVVFDEDKTSILAIGLARYDSDRGGAQEDDRTGGYFNCAQELFMFTKLNKLRTKLVFINDGPGLYFEHSHLKLAVNPFFKADH